MRKKILGCNENCFMCPYPDCLKGEGFKTDKAAKYWQLNESEGMGGFGIAGQNVTVDKIILRSIK